LATLESVHARRFGTEAALAGRPGDHMNTDYGDALKKIY
jgi:hypothetical protein